MPGIFKVSFNEIHAEQRIDKEGGKPVGKKTLHQWSVDSDPLDDAKFGPIKGGNADNDETVAADDAEDAIKKVRAAKIGKPEDYELEDDRGDIKAGQWMRSTVEAIQIVRVEPVAFTTV